MNSIVCLEISLVLWRYMIMIDIKGNSPDRHSARLSNFTERHFFIDGVFCNGVEGFLQALKCQDTILQKEICALSGKKAKKRGADFDTWKKSQTLWWLGKEYPRKSRDYLILVTRAYDLAYLHDHTFHEDLTVIGHEPICHSIGNPDMNDTVLTEVEMLYQLNRLRIRALKTS
jgi:hypothetical protein